MDSDEAVDLLALGGEVSQGKDALREEFSPTLTPRKPRPVILRKVGYFFIHFLLKVK